MTIESYSHSVIGRATSDNYAIVTIFQINGGELFLLKWQKIWVIFRKILHLKVRGSETNYRKIVSR